MVKQGYYCLTGVDFYVGLQAIHMYFPSSWKFGYLTGETKAPAKSKLHYAVQDAEHSMSMTWLVNSMNEDINKK